MTVDMDSSSDSSRVFVRKHVFGVFAKSRAFLFVFTILFSLMAVSRRIIVLCLFIVNHRDLRWMLCASWDIR